MWKNRVDHEPLRRTGLWWPDDDPFTGIWIPAICLPVLPIRGVEALSSCRTRAFLSFDLGYAKQLKESFEHE